jgi:hypothetical protein
MNYKIKMTFYKLILCTGKYKSRDDCDIIMEYDITEIDYLLDLCFVCRKEKIKNGVELIKYMQKYYNDLIIYKREDRDLFLSETISFSINRYDDLVKKYILIEKDTTFKINLDIY